MTFIHIYIYINIHKKCICSCEFSVQFARKMQKVKTDEQINNFVFLRADECAGSFCLYRRLFYIYIYIYTYIHIYISKPHYLT